jgi:hypothetical protein
VHIVWAWAVDPVPDRTTSQKGSGSVMDDRERGLYDKYKVERVDGKAAGRCIVFDWLNYMEI